MLDAKFIEALTGARNTLALARCKVSPVIDADAMSQHLTAVAAAHAEIVAERDALKDEAITWEARCVGCGLGEAYTDGCPALAAINYAREATDDHETGTD